jgi:rRNA maturation endonuclease Nob1
MRRSQSLALVLGAALGAAGLGLTRVPQEEIEMSPSERDRQREKRLNERRWAEMTQADIARLTAAHEKRERRKSKVKP